MVSLLWIQRRPVLHFTGEIEQIFQLLGLKLRVELVTLDDSQYLLQELVLRVALVDFNPSFEENGYEAADHVRIARKELFYLVKRDVVLVVCRPKSLTGEVARCIKTRQVAKLWKLQVVQFELLYKLDSILDFVKLDEDIDQLDLLVDVPLD